MTILKQTYQISPYSRHLDSNIFKNHLCGGFETNLDGHFHLHDYLYLRDRGRTAQRTRCEDESPAPRAPASILAALLSLSSVY